MRMLYSTCVASPDCHPIRQRVAACGEAIIITVGDKRAVAGSTAAPQRSYTLWRFQVLGRSNAC